MKRLALVSMVAFLASTGMALAQTQPTGTKPAPKDPPKTTTPGKTNPTTDDGKGKDKAEATLKAGSAAPAIEISDWVKGSAVTGFEKGKVYVVEFWATWCPPCRESIPHLTKLQKAHKDITVIGVASSEKDKESSKRLEKVKKFVTDQGDKMAYTVGYDAERKMAKDWMKPAGQSGIPCAFIVGADGKIAWIGNPLDDKFDGEIENAIKAAATSGPKVDDKNHGKKG